MNNSFNFPRLWRLILKQGMENARFYFLYYLATLGIMALMLAFWVTIKNNHYYEEHFYSYMLLALFLSGTLFANLQFEALSKKARGIAWLSFPAGHLEKLLCAVFYTFIIFNSLFWVTVLLVKWLLITFITIYAIPEGTSWIPMASPFTETQQFYFIFLFIAVQAFYLLGSAYFTRFSFAKTTVLLVILIGGFALYLTLLDKYLLGPDYNWIQDEMVYAVASEKVGGIFFHKVYRPSPWLTETITWLVRYSWAPAFWIITWKRLAEKEI